MTKIKRLTHNVLQQLDYLNTLTTPVVKNQIFDSTWNHRTLSVSQVIRYLKADPVFATFQSNLGFDLERVHQTLLQKKLYKKLRRRNNRTDAIDFSEFLKVVNTYVENNPSLKSVLGTKILSV